MQNQNIVYLLYIIYLHILKDTVSQYIQHSPPPLSLSIDTSFILHYSMSVFREEHRAHLAPGPLTLKGCIA